VKGSKSPNAAKLLAEYTLSLEAQKLWPESGIYAARVDAIRRPKAEDQRHQGDPMDYAYITSATAQVKAKVQRDFLDLITVRHSASGSLETDSRPTLTLCSELRTISVMAGA